MEDRRHLLVQAFAEVTLGEEPALYQRLAERLLAERIVELLRREVSEPEHHFPEALSRPVGAGATYLAVLEGDRSLRPGRTHGEHAGEARLVDEGDEVGDGEGGGVPRDEAAWRRRRAPGDGRPARDEQVRRGREQREAAGAVRERALRRLVLGDDAAVSIDIQDGHGR